MNVRQAQAALRGMGFVVKVDGSFGPKTSAVLKAFQAGFSLPHPKTGKPITLKLTGRLDAATQRAIEMSVKAKGRVSKRYYWRDFKSPGDGTIKVARFALRRLEIACDRLPSVPRRWTRGNRLPFGGNTYRDPVYNAKLRGAASKSQHVRGTAFDVKAIHTLAQWKSLRLFTGLGYNGHNRTVRHVDLRPGSATSPTTWKY